MKNILTPVLLSLVLGLGSGAFAQESSEQAEPQETSPQTETITEAVDGEFPVANDDPQPGDEYTRETHGDWAVNCIKVQEGEEDVCQIYQLLSDEDGNSVAEFRLVALPKGGQAVAGATVTTPLGTLLTAKIAMRVDAGKVKRYDYSWCTQVGCFARFGLTNGEIAGMRKGAKATVTIAAVTAPDSPLPLELSLTGFTAAWNAISN